MDWVPRNMERKKQLTIKAVKESWAMETTYKLKLSGSRESKRQGMQVRRQQMECVRGKTMQPTREVLRGARCQALL